MGLGKTLTTIALLWTLLRQGVNGRPTSRRVLIAVPASLVSNWRAELHKWLGDERLGAVAVLPGGGGAGAVAAWRAGGAKPVLVASYEAIRSLAIGPGAVDVLVCDEAHRLKAVQSATQDSLKALRAPRCLLLTGTPLQNNLSELWATLDFAVPGMLGSLPAFQRVFAGPIAAAADARAAPAEKELGATRAAELAARVSAAVLRRTADVLRAGLPPLTVVDVFCRLTPAQVQTHRSLIARGALATLGTGATATTVLPLIGRMKALCVAPALVSGEAADGSTAPPARPPLPDAADLIASSGKLTVLAAMLATAAAAGHKTVVASTRTSALDAVAHACAHLSLSVARIDGRTPPAARLDVVNSFNGPAGAPVLLLSIRAGGAGLNLVGACRIVLLDLDWNPAHNAQALARVWREGQTRPCFAYRLHAAGSLDEKLFQRVLFKQGLADALGGGGGGANKKGNGPAFSRDELRSLFDLDERTECSTRDLVLKGEKGTGSAALAASWAARAAAGTDACLDAAEATGAVTWARAVRGGLADDEGEADAEPAAEEEKEAAATEAADDVGSLELE